MNGWIDIGPDIEVEADQWEDEQAALAEANRQDGEINSCDALRIIDGVSLVQEDE